MQKISLFVQKATKYLYMTLMVLIVALCATCKAGTYYTQKTLLLPNISYLFVGLGGIFVVASILKKTSGKCRIKKDKQVMFFLNILFGIVLLGCSYHYYFRTGWDAGVTIQEAIKIANGNFDELWNFYFDRCPNNIFITILFSWIIRVGRLLPFGNDYLYLVMFLCIMWAYTGYMVYCVAVRLCEQKNTAVLVWLLYIVLIGMSPWVVVPYTDTMALPVLITLLYLYLTNKGYLLFGLLLMVGYYIKPQVLILAIAIVLIQLFADKEQKKKLDWKKAGGFAAGVVIGFLVVNMGQAACGITITGEASFGIPHYLMIGLNEETDGMFSDDDFLFSQSFTTSEERNRANLQEAGRRLKNMGASGLLMHLKNKLLLVYEDGSFAWGTEGDFFAEKYYSGVPILRELFWAIYLPGGKNYPLFLSVMQSCWMGVLLLAVFAMMGKESRKTHLVLAMTIIGVTLFELLFEARARHLLFYVPVYLLLFASGMEKLKRYIHK